MIFIDIPQCSIGIPQWGFTWSSLPSCLKSDPLVTLELPPMKTDHELHQLDLCLKINRVPHGNPYGTQKSRSNLIFLI